MSGREVAVIVAIVNATLAFWAGIVVAGQARVPLLVKNASGATAMIFGVAIFLMIVVFIFEANSFEDHWDAALVIFLVLFGLAAVISGIVWAAMFAPLVLWIILAGLALVGVNVGFPIAWWLTGRHRRKIAQRQEDEREAMTRRHERDQRITVLEEEVLP